VPLVLRKIRKSKWYESESVPWLTKEDLQADALVDLATKGNRLSVYLVNYDHTNLEQVITALAANCDYVSDFDFALFDHDALWELGIRIENSDGDTPDSVVNSWHCELIELTAERIVALAGIIWKRAEKKRFLSKRVHHLLAHAVASGQIDRDKMRLGPGSLAKVDQIIKSAESL
jgi:hypothetical protein